MPSAELRLSQIFTVNSQSEGRVHVLNTKPPPSAAFSPGHAERIYAQPNKVTGKYTGFLAAHAHSVWTQDRNSNNLFGFYWDGSMPFYLPANGEPAVQGAALDVLNTQIQ